jgi:hypothetical protein
MSDLGKRGSGTEAKSIIGHWFHSRAAIIAIRLQIATWCARRGLKRLETDEPIKNTTVCRRLTGYAK